MLQIGKDLPAVTNMQFKMLGSEHIGNLASLCHITNDNDSSIGCKRFSDHLRTDHSIDFLEGKQPDRFGKLS